MTESRQPAMLTPETIEAAQVWTPEGFKPNEVTARSVVTAFLAAQDREALVEAGAKELCCGGACGFSACPDNDCIPQARAVVDALLGPKARP